MEDIKKYGLHGLSADLPGQIYYGIQGPKGETGGHYIPEVNQTAGDTVEISFTPSEPDMPPAEPVIIKLLFKAINGIRRKVNAHSGAIQTIYEQTKENETRNNCRFYAAGGDGTYVEYLLGSNDARRRIRISTNVGTNTAYQITRLSGYGIENLYSAKHSADRTLLGVWLDGTKYESIDVLKDENTEFESMVILYTANSNEYTVNTCLTVNAQGFRIYESIPEEVEIGTKLVKTVLTSSYLSHIYTAADRHSVFLINGVPNSLYIEKIEDLGNVVVKTVDFNGGL